MILYSDNIVILKPKCSQLESFPKEREHDPPPLPLDSIVSLSLHIRRPSSLTIPLNMCVFEDKSLNKITLHLYTYKYTPKHYIYIYICMHRYHQGTSMALNLYFINIIFHIIVSIWVIPRIDQVAPICRSTIKPQIR